MKFLRWILALARFVPGTPARRVRRSRLRVALQMVREAEKRDLRAKEVRRQLPPNGA